MFNPCSLSLILYQLVNIIKSKVGIILMLLNICLLNSIIDEFYVLRVSQIRTFPIIFVQLFDTQNLAT